MKKYINMIIVAVVILVIMLGIFILLKNKPQKAGLPLSNSQRAFSPDAKELLDKAEALEAGSNYTAAKQIYQSVLYDYPDIEISSDIQQRISSLNTKVLFSTIPTEKSALYEVVPGDSLAKIAKKFNTTVELIKKSNGLTSDLIRPLMRLKIQKNKFSIVVDKSQNTLTLLADGEVFKMYRVSTGTDNSTPVGEFRVVNKLIDPPWYSAKGVIPPESPENVLGTRWLGIDNPGYGIHGTTSPQTIGSQNTEGCVRMYNSDVEELYAIVPRGTEVTIID